MASFKTSSGGVVESRSLQRGGLAWALVALLVGCGGSGTTTGGGGEGGGGAGGVGSAGKTGSAGKGGGGAGGAAGSAAGATGTAGGGGATGAAGGGGAGGGTGGVGGAAGHSSVGGAAGHSSVGGAAGKGVGGAAGGAGVGTPDASADARDVDAGTHATDTGCQGVDLTGIGVPVGTVATASMSYDSTHRPEAAIDGDPATDWTPGMSDGRITLTFPSPVMISAVRIHGDALPETSEMFSVTTSTSTVPLGSATYSVPLWPGRVLPDIQVTPGLYSNITLTINGGASWASVIQLWLLAAPACP